MPKLRKMLGSADHPTVQKLMRLIETQNKQTLAAWAVDYVAAHDLPILTAHGGDSAPFSRAIEGVRAHLAGRLPLKELKPLLKEASNAARSETDPISQAAARALSAAIDGEAGRFNAGSIVFNALIGVTLALPFFNVGPYVARGVGLA